VRLEKLPNNTARDAALRSDIERLQRRYAELCQKQRGRVAVDAPLPDFPWFIEELRVSLFAQEVKSIMPISVKRLEKILDAM